MQDIDNQYILDFLKENKLAVISTVTPEGLPQAAAIYYMVDDDFTMYFVTSVDTKKSNNIEENPNIALTITSVEENTTVQISGVAEIDPDLLQDTLERLAVKLNLGPDFVTSLPLLQHKNQSKIVFRIVPKQVLLYRYRSNGMDKVEADLG